MYEVVLYGTVSCAKCEEIYNYFKEHNVPFKYFQIGKDVVLEQLELAVSRRITTDDPIITVNGAEVSYDYMKRAVEHFENQ